MRLNLARTLPKSAANGPGERFVVWVQGCPLACPGCWNPDTWSFAPRRVVEVAAMAEEILAVSGIEGVTFTGGEPFMQAHALAALGRAALGRAALGCAALGRALGRAALAALGRALAFLVGRVGDRRQRGGLRRPLDREVPRQQVGLLVGELGALLDHGRDHRAPARHVVAAVPLDLVELVAVHALGLQQALARLLVHLGLGRVGVVDRIHHRLGARHDRSALLELVLGRLLDLRGDRHQVRGHVGDVLGVELVAEHGRLLQHAVVDAVPALGGAGLDQHRAHVVAGDALADQHLAPPIEGLLGHQGLDVDLGLHVHLGQQLAHALDVVRVGGAPREVVGPQGVGHREHGHGHRADEQAKAVARHGLLEVPEEQQDHDLGDEQHADGDAEHGVDHRPRGQLVLVLPKPREHEVHHHDVDHAVRVAGQRVHAQPELGGAGLLGLLVPELGTPEPCLQKDGDDGQGQERDAQPHAQGGAHVSSGGGIRGDLSGVTGNSPGAGLPGPSDSSVPPPCRRGRLILHGIRGSG
ncbi:MAG: radical SAM protein [Myxococcales bacterium]|nr:radical SAM protein [Myxococcales bacterium]